MRKRLPPWPGHVLDAIGVVVKIIESHAILGAVVSGALAVLALLWAQSLAFFSEPRTQLAIGLWLAILWTYIGLRVLANLRAVHRVRPDPDYRYCINPEGYMLAVDPEATAGLALSVWFNFRNATAWPLSLKIEFFEVRVDDRVSPSGPKQIEMILPRSSARTIRSGGFRQEVLRQESSPGTLSATIVYGAPGEPPLRRYKFNAKLLLVFKRNETGALVHSQVIEESFEDEESAI